MLLHSASRAAHVSWRRRVVVKRGGSADRESQREQSKHRGCPERRQELGENEKSLT